MNIACNSAVVFVAAEAAPPHYTQLHTTATGAVTSSFRPSFVRRILLPDYGKMTLALPGAAPVTHSLTHPPSLPVSPSVSQSVSQSVSLQVCLSACVCVVSKPLALAVEAAHGGALCMYYVHPLTARRRSVRRVCGCSSFSIFIQHYSLRPFFDTATDYPFSR